MKTLMTLIACVLLGNPAIGYSQTVFKCTDSSGTIIFSDSPCASNSEVLYLQDEQSGISSVEPGYDVYQPEYGDPMSNARNPRTADEQARAEDSEAIDFLEREQRDRCGTKYYGKSESTLERSQGIARKGTASGAREDASEISCHLNYMKRIERVEFGGKAYALEHDLIDEANKQARRQRAAAQAQAQPQWLIDPYTGTAMPRTGGGYTDPMDGTFYVDEGAGVVNTKTGEFIPTND